MNKAAPRDFLIETAGPFFIKRNAFLAAKKILATEGEMPEPLLTLAWETLTDLAGYARPAKQWTPGTWTRCQAVERR